MTDEQPTSGPIHTHFGKFQMAITLQCIIQLPSCLVLRNGFRQG